MSRVQSAPDFENRPHRTLQGTLGAGASLAAGGTLQQLIPVHGARYVRLRFKASIGVTLKAEFIRPGISADPTQQIASAAPYATGQPASVAVAAATEGLMDVVCSGEAYLLLTLTFVPSAGATITFIDACEL